MHIYLAGCDNDQFAKILGGQSVLSSFYHMNKNKVADFHAYGFKNWFLDCGAYSAWSQGTSIDLDEYCEFCKTYEEYFTVYAHLDVKGDVAATMRNLKYMEDQGLKPLPVWHLSYNFKLLEEMLEKYEYIAIGGMAGEKDEADLFDRLLKRTFKITFDKYYDKSTGKLSRKFHAFGQTSTERLLDYPWFSADSTAWLNGARFGTMPFFDTKKRKVRTMQFSKKEDYHKYWHYLPPEFRDINRLADLSGAKNYENRLKVAIYAFEVAEEFITKAWEARKIKF